MTGGGLLKAQNFGSWAGSKGPEGSPSGATFQTQRLHQAAAPGGSRSGKDTSCKPPEHPGLGVAPCDEVCTQGPKQDRCTHYNLSASQEA